MSEEIYACKCGFKCVLSQLNKTDGYCPKCNEGLKMHTERLAKANYSKRVV